MVELRGTRSSSRIKAEPGLKRKLSDALEGAAATTSAKPTKTAKTTKSNLKSAPPPPKEPSIEVPKTIVLPSKFTDSTPLPVLPAAQPDELDEKEWQALGDSGVFAASLARSRLAIAKGALFEKFWTKPTTTKKQKDMTEEEKMQLKAAKGPTQSKVGLVKMVCEPLTFEVQLLMIKDQHQGHRQGQLPPDRQHLIYGTPHRTASPAYTAPYRPPVHQQPIHTPVKPPAPITPNPAPPRPQPTPAPARLTPSQPQPQPQPPQVRPNPTTTPARPVPPPARPTPTPARTTPAPASAPASKPAPSSSRPSAPATQAPDPVIHALAQRASANPELKAVMKIVATGLASQQQLQYFQKHIDELTEMVRQRQQDENARKGITAPSASTGPRPANSNANAATPNRAIPVPARSTPTPAPASSGTPQPAGAPRPVQTPSTIGPQQQVNRPASAAPPTSASTPKPTPVSTPTPTPSSAPTPKPAVAPSTVTAPSPAPASKPMAAPSPAPAPRPTPGPIAAPALNSPAPSSTPTPNSALTPRPAPTQHTPYSRPPHPQQGIMPGPTSTPIQQPRPPHQAIQQNRPPHQPIQQQPYHYQPPTPAPPRPKMVTTATPLHILIQFSENPNERFLFPKTSILEYNATLTEVVVSFVVVKKDKEGKDCWAPVTLTFKGDAPTLGVLGRVAEPFEVARRGVEDKMLSCDRAEDGYLAFRLPREEKVVEIG